MALSLVRNLFVKNFLDIQDSRGTPTPPIGMGMGLQGVTGMQLADSFAIEEGDSIAPLKITPGNIYAGTGMKVTHNPDFAQSSTLF